jgi:hypothetical protein
MKEKENNSVSLPLLGCSGALIMLGFIVSTVGYSIYQLIA